MKFIPNNMFKFITSTFKLGVLAGVSLMILLLLYIISVTKDLPSTESLIDYKPMLKSRVYARDGSLMLEYGSQSRIYLPIETIPDKVKYAFIAAEDSNFYKHNGIDLYSIFRASIQNFHSFKNDKDTRLIGASTITQQVVKNVLLSNKRTIQRKVKEAILAIQVSKEVSKDKILEIYLNEIFLGSRNYGIASASLDYFNKSVKNLSVAEAAMLAALPKSPNKLNPKHNYSAALERRNWVIKRMRMEGVITKKEAELAMQSPIVLRKRNLDSRRYAHHFSEAVRKQVIDIVGKKEFYTRGYNITTSLEPDYQYISYHKLKSHLIKFDKKYGYRGPLTNLVELQISNMIKLGKLKQKKLQKLIPEPYFQEYLLTRLKEQKNNLNQTENKLSDNDTKIPQDINLDEIEKYKFNTKQLIEITKRWLVDLNKNLYNNSNADDESNQSSTDDNDNDVKYKIITIPNSKIKINLTKLWQDNRKLLAKYKKFSDWNFALVEEFNDKQATIILADQTKAILNIKNAQWARKQIINPKKNKKYELGRKIISLKQILNIGDIILVQQDKDKYYKLQQYPEINGSVIIADIKNQAIQAMVGGIEETHFSFNRAMQAQRQPGSLIKPFVYLTALLNGYQPNTIIIDESVNYTNEDGSIWSPQNYSSKYYGPTPMRVGLEKSRNVMTVRLSSQIGLSSILKTTRTLGIYDVVDKTDMSLSLGSQSTSLYRLAKAFAVIANYGYDTELNLIEKVQDEYGNIVYNSNKESCINCNVNLDQIDFNKNEKILFPDKKGTKKLIIDPRSNYQLISMMEGVVQRGTGVRIKYNVKDAVIAGKTGTTNEHKDLWFIGFTPDIIVAIYVGYDKPRTVGNNEPASRFVVPMFIDIMKSLPPSTRPFKIPKGLKQVKTDYFTGLPPTLISEQKNIFLEVLKDKNYRRSEEEKTAILKNRQIRQHNIDTNIDSTQEMQNDNKDYLQNDNKIKFNEGIF